MTDTILDTLTACLTEAGVPAVRAWPETKLDTDSACVCVGLKSCKASGSGMGEYLGVRQASGGSEETELYGVRMEIEIALTVFAPTAAACASALDLLSAALDLLPSGLKAQALICTETKPDKTAGMFRCEAVLCAQAYFVAESNAESGEFLDFELRGVLHNADE